MGYKPFMVAIQNQVSILNKLLATKQRVVTPPIPPTPVSRSRTTSCSDMNSQCGTIVGGATLPSSPSSVADGTTPDDGAVFNEQEDTASNISATSESPASGTAAQAESNCIISWSFFHTSLLFGEQDLFFYPLKYLKQTASSVANGGAFFELIVFESYSSM